VLDGTSDAQLGGDGLGRRRLVEKNQQILTMRQ